MCFKLNRLFYIAQSHYMCFKLNRLFYIAQSHYVCFKLDRLFYIAQSHYMCFKLNRLCFIEDDLHNTFIIALRLFTVEWRPDDATDSKTLSGNTVLGFPRFGFAIIL